MRYISIIFYPFEPWLLSLLSLISCRKCANFPDFVVLFGQFVRPFSGVDKNIFIFIVLLFSILFDYQKKY